MAILKRPGKRRAAPEGKLGTNDGWYPDPYERHASRYWSGHYWTEHVADDGVQDEDVPGISD